MLTDTPDAKPTTVTLHYSLDTIRAMIADLDAALTPMVPFTDDLDTMREEATERRLILIARVREMLKEHPAFTDWPPF